MGLSYWPIESAIPFWLLAPSICMTTLTRGGNVKFSVP